MAREFLMLLAVAFFTTTYAGGSVISPGCYDAVEGLCGESRSDFDACATCVKSSKETLLTSCEVGGLTVVESYCGDLDLDTGVSTSATSTGASCTDGSGCINGMCADGTTCSDTVEEIPAADLAPEDVAKAKFAEYDLDGSGQIEQSELEALIAGVMGQDPGPETLAEAERCLDREGKGYITWEEFKQWFFSDEEGEQDTGIVDVPVDPLPYLPTGEENIDALACYTCECKPGKELHG
jgi:hypothetical protein